MNMKTVQEIRKKLTNYVLQDRDNEKMSQLIRLV